MRKNVIMLRGDTNMMLNTINLSQSGFEVCKPSHKYGPAVRDHYLIHYVISGCGIFYYEGNKVPIHSGQMFMIMPDEKTMYQADLNNPWSYCWFGIDGNDIETIIKSIGFSKALRVRDYNHGEYGIIEGVRALVDNRIESKGDQLKETGYLYLLLGQMVKAYEESLDYNTDLIELNRHVKIAVNYMEKHYMHDITIQDVAEHVGIDRTQLYRVFYMDMEMGPKEYLLKMRIEKACVMLRNTEHSIKHIGLSVGYRDPYQFSKIFKKWIGSSPREFRKQDDKNGDNIC